jgi:hypothetical protein
VKIICRSGFQISTNMVDQSEVNLENWVRVITEAVSPNIGSKEQATNFALSLRSSLAKALPRGVQLQGAQLEAKRLEQLGIDSLEAVQQLRRHIAAGSLMGRKIESAAAFRTGKRCGLGTLPLASIAEAFLTEYLTHDREEQKRIPAVRRGPQSTFARTVAAAIARDYRIHFGKLPGKGNRDRDKNPTPYHNICNAVERLLAELGHVDSEGVPWIRLSDGARADGIRAVEAEWDE